jgi:hypothetical protein
MPLSLALAALLCSVPDANVRAFEPIAEDVADADALDVAARFVAPDALTLEISASLHWLAVDGRRQDGWAIWATVAVRPEVWWRAADEPVGPRTCAELPRILSPQLRARAIEALGCAEVSP